MNSSSNQENLNDSTRTTATSSRRRLFFNCYFSSTPNHNINNAISTTRPLGDLTNNCNQVSQIETDLNDEIIKMDISDQEEIDYFESTRLNNNLSNVLEYNIVNSSILEPLFGKLVEK